MSMMNLLRPAVLLVLFGLCGCTLSPQRPDFPELTWTHLPPITLNVAEIEIMDATQPTSASPHVEDLFPLPPGEAAQRWARDRLRAGGAANRARFVIQRAEVIEVNLRQTPGLSGWFTKDQSERYDADLAVLLEIRSNAGERLGQVSAELRKSRSVPEDASLNERESIWFAITDDLMKLLNAEMERTMPQYLGRWMLAR
jgi:hypothetical protein